MTDDLNEECKELKNNCTSYDALNNITEPDFDHGCWKYFLDVCTGNETSASVSNLALVISLVVIAVLSIGANSIVGVVFLLYRELRLIKHYFLINLAVADIVIAAILIPLFVAQLLTGNTALCRFELVLDIACGTASILSLSMISLERYVAVVYCLQYNSLVTHRKAVWCVVFIWLYSLLVSCAAVPSLIKSMKTLTPTKCFFMDRTYVTFITFASFIIPVSVMVAAYGKIFAVARTHVRRIRSNEPAVAGQQAKTRIKRELKGAKTLTIIMGTHIICWCPLFVSLLIYTYCPSCWNKAMETMNFVVVFLLYCNSLANPLIYSGINRQFRAAIKRFVLSRNDAVELIHTTASSRP